MALIKAPQYLRAKRRTINLLPPAAAIDVARFRAGLAADAIVHRELEELDEGPVALRVKQLLEPAQEAIHEALLLLRRLGLRHIEIAMPVEREIISLQPAGFRRFEGRFGGGRRQRHEHITLQRGQGLDVAPGNVAKGDGLPGAHFLPSGSAVVCACCNHVWPGAICGAAQVAP